MKCCDPDAPSLPRAHGDHDPMPYDGYNSDISHLCQICGQAMTLDLTDQKDPS